MIEKNIRMGYITIPIDYVRELKGRGQRDKARAFMEYFDDVETNDVNSFSFYAKGWDVSKSTAHEWIKEFKYEIERYFSYWLIKNDQHYSSVKKSTERLPNGNRTIDTLESPMVSSLAKSNRTATERQPNEVFNINNNNNSGQINFYDKNFEDLYLRAKRFYKFTGNKEDAYNEYMSQHQHITHNDMAFAYILHVNDPQCKGRFYNLANFMKNQIYISYLMPRIQVIQENDTLEGWYDKDKNMLQTDKGNWELTEERFRDKVIKGEIVILPQMRASI